MPVSHALSGAVRIVLYLFVLSSAILVLYEMLKMKAAVYDEQPGGFCLLWGGNWQNDTSLMPFSGNKAVCEFVIFSAVSQILLSVLLGIIAVLRIVTGKLKELSPYSYLELALISISVLVGLVTAAMVTGGLYKTCSVLLKGWRVGPTGGPYADKPSSCSVAYFAWQNNGEYSFYHDMSLAQIGSWVCTVAWALHMVLTCFNCCSYRRGAIGGPSAHVPLAMAEGRAPGSYRKLDNDGSL